MSRPESPYQVGRVIEVDPATARVRVVLPAYDDLPSWWLPVLQQKTLLDQAYWMPDLDEHVICLVDRNAEAGIVLGAIYSDVVPPPIASTEKWLQKFMDGTEIEYDRSTHALRVALTADDATIHVSTTGNVTVASEEGDVTVNVAEGQKVVLGGAGALELATKAFVETQYVPHTHPTPAGISGPPVPTGMELLHPSITERAVGR